MSSGSVSMSSFSDLLESGSVNGENEDSSSASSTLKVKRRKLLTFSSGCKIDGDGTHGTGVHGSRYREQDGEKEATASTLKVKLKKLSASSSGPSIDHHGTHQTPVLRSRNHVHEVCTPTSTHRHPCTVLSWLIDNNVVLPRQKVWCYRCGKGNPLLEGKIYREGIKCSCCQNVLTLGAFGSHAGCSNDRPAANIFLEDGKSLLECQMQIMTEREKKSSRSNPDDALKGSLLQIENDSFCNVCQDGGSLILCDGCPSVFHKSCIGLKIVPEGDWFCPACRCGICDGIIEHTLHCNTCDQCESKYHTNCWMKWGERCKDNLQSGFRENWFCSNNCQKIFLTLQKRLGKQIPVGVDDLTWSLWKPVRFDRDLPNGPDNDAATESYTKLSLALQVMRDCFKQPKPGRHLGEVLIFNRGTNLDGMNVKGFYTMILEKNDEVISAATVRIYGAKVAEVPLVGTKSEHRKKGMCHVLMRSLEKMLQELGVERLLLPVVLSSIQKWNKSFGFLVIEGSDMRQFLGNRFMHFEDTNICQKCLGSTSVAEPQPPQDNVAVFLAEDRASQIKDTGNDTLRPMEVKAREETSYEDMFVPQKQVRSAQVYIELSDSDTESLSLEDPDVMSSASASEVKKFRGMAKLNPEFVPLLNEVCSRHPSLIECHKDYSPEIAEWAFTALGKVIYFLKTRKVKDMMPSACEELQRLYNDLKVFKFDLSWLEPHVKAAVDMKKPMESVEEAKRITEKMNALVMEYKVLEEKLLVEKLELGKRLESPLRYCD